jgi:transposase
MLEQLRQKGLTLYVLPPYSPKLNRIEILWRKVKYEWMAFKTPDTKSLLAALGDIFGKFGKFGKHYQLTF